MAGRIERLFVDIIGKNDKLNQALKDSDNKIKEFARNTSATLNKVGSRFQQLGRQITTAVTLPLLGIGIAATKIGVEFETQFNRVIALTNATEEETKALREEIKRLGAETPFAAREVAQAFQFLALAGLSANEAIIAAEGTLQLAQAGALDLASAADIATNVLKGLRLEVTDLGRVNDVLAFTASNANTNVLEFAEAAKIAGPVAAELNISVEELATQIGALADAGIKGTLAGTALRRGLLNLTAPTSQQADELERLNINIFDAEGNFLGFNKVIGQIEQGLAGATQEQKAQTLSLIFGARAVSSFAVLLNEGEESLSAFTEELENAEGTAARIAETNLRGAPGAFARFKSAVEALFITISESLLPVLTILLETYITPLVVELGKAEASTIKLAIAISLLVASIGPLLIGLGVSIKILGAVFGLFSALIGSAQFLVAAFKGIGIAASGIGGPLTILLAVLIPLLLANEEFRNLLLQILSVFLSLISPIIEVVSALVNLLLPIINILIAGMVPLLRLALLPTLKIFSLIAQILPHVANGLDKLAEGVKVIIKPFAELAKLLGIIADEADNIAGIEKPKLGIDFENSGLPSFDSLGIDFSSIFGNGASPQTEVVETQNQQLPNPLLPIGGEQVPTTIEINQYGVTSEEQTALTLQAIQEALREEQAKLGVDE